MPKFRRLTAAEASTLTREQLLDRIEREQVYWHRRMDRGQMRDGEAEAFGEFGRILHAAVNPADGVHGAPRLVWDGHDDGSGDAGAEVPRPLRRRRSTSPDGGPNLATGYLRCPRCGVVAVPGSTDYPIIRDGALDESRPIEVTCSHDGHRYQVGVTAFLPRDAARTCARPGCGTMITCPATADEVECPACHLHQPGPAVDDAARRDQVRRVFADHAATLRARLGHSPA